MSTALTSGKAPSGQDIQVVVSSSGMTSGALSVQEQHAGEVGQNAAAPASKVSTAADAAQDQSPLQSSPDSWLRQFIMSLPSDSLLALFRSSKWLSKHVLQTTTEVELRLRETEQLEAQQTQARRRIITDILSVRQAFQVYVNPTPWQPFPAELAGRVTKLNAGWRVSPASICCQWANMSNLHTLCLQDCKTNLLVEDLAGICAAVQAGQLQQLRSFELKQHYQFKEDVGTIHNLDRFVKVLSSQLDELSTNCRPLLLQLYRFTALRGIAVEDFECDDIADAVMQQIMEHPKLRNVAIATNVWSRRGVGDYSQHACKWETLTLHYSSLNMLLRLPMDYVQHVRLLGHASGSRAEDEQGHARVQQAAADMLKRTADKIVCEGIYSLEPYKEFYVMDACEAMLPLLKRLSNVEALELNQSEYPMKPGLLASTLLAVPGCVTSVTLTHMNIDECSQLWQSLPQHVATVTLEGCAMSAADACNLVLTAPPHVTTMLMSARGHSQHAAWVAAGLYESAPAHLELELNDPWNTSSDSDSETDNDSDSDSDNESDNESDFGGDNDGNSDSESHNDNESDGHNDDDSDYNSRNASVHGSDSDEE